MASPTVTYSHKAEIPACRSLIYSCKAEISAWKLKETVTNNVVSGSSGSGDPTLWELWGEMVKYYVSYPIQHIKFLLYQVPSDFLASYTKRVS